MILDLGGGVALELLQVPGGEFLMGSAAADAKAANSERPQHTVWLPEYWIGKYPVTVAQYRAFVQGSAYQAANPDVTKGPDNHPAVAVTWSEVLAFCDWVSRASGCEVRLPSEAEWEKAARGTDGRLYPWGNQWDPARCNTRERGVGRTTSVGRYSPLGDSPYGCADMAGNVWEWTLSLWGSGPEAPDFGYPYDPKDGREKTAAGDGVLRVVRGGSFSGNEAQARCAMRYRNYTSNRYDGLGFRVLALPTPP